MMTRNKRAVISVAIVAGIAVVVASGFTLTGPVIEQWYLWKLESEDEEERRTAVERLADMRSVRAVPRLLSMLRTESKHQQRLGLAGSALARIGPPAIPLLLE